MARCDDARVTSIYRYPVKGLAGERLDVTHVSLGLGLPHDRRFAITSGVTPPPGDGSWRARRNFLHLAKNPDLTGIGARVDGDVLRLDDPVHGSVYVALEGTGSAVEANGPVAHWFPDNAGAPRLVEADRGYWDCEDATVSLVNLETLSELARQAGRDIDPARFRANLYVTGLAAWAELGLIGRRVRIGDAELEILRPIGRCRATSVDPDSGETDLNVPALLGTTYGHICCGVYARVRRAGVFSAGQRLCVVPLKDDEPSPPAPSAPAVGAPRPARLLRSVRETDTVTSLWLREPSLFGDTDPAGRHIRVHAADANGPLWRSYTVTAAEAGLVRISVRRQDQGRMSHLLHRLAVGGELLVSGPFAGGTLPGEPDVPILLASAGIGITPMLAMLRSLCDRAVTAPLLLCHTARDARELALWEEARSLVDRLAGGRASLHLSRPRPGDCERLGAHSGRPSVAEIAGRYLPLSETLAYLCGPDGFLEQHESALRAAGVTGGRLRYEVFSSPRATAGARTPPPSPGPFRVHFANSDVTADWDPDAGSLLDLGEEAGLALPSGCREGACHSCRQRVSHGSVAYTVEPTLRHTSESVLLCCAVPTTDLVVDA